VRAHSDGLGRGSEFTVRLPASSSPPRADDRAGRATPPPRTDRTRRVLVVDDNRDAAEMISQLLEEAGHEVQTAVDASQALSMADAFHPQIAILDIGLPVIDGYSLGRELRARMGRATPVLIALTGYGQEQDQRRSAEAGFTSHVVKPVDADGLIDLVAGLDAGPR
jgi:CheY-like chemotaxis protein